ncbi:MAG: hypothetical protein H7Z70_00240 [Bacteroidia bacterium]|nr:hypothetical protein [Methylotenera sp.]
MIHIHHFKKANKISISFFLLAMLFTMQAHAATDESFGRLFTRPNERSNLDYLRQNQKLKIVNPQNDPQQDAIKNDIPVELPDPITLQGYVKRSDGTKSTLWINNQAVQEDSIVNNVQIGRLNSRNGSKINQGTDGLDLKIPANGKHIRLKAGQVYEPETNQIKELKTVEKERRLNLEETGVIDETNGTSASKH